jgi:carboxymethylenebutenolidase
MIKLTARDGFTFNAYVNGPSNAPLGAIVVVPEIFGVNQHIRSVADRYAAAGYLAIAPAFFDRVAPGYEVGYSPEEIQIGIAHMNSLNWDHTFQDLDAAIAHVAHAGKVGIVGYCWGGTVAWRAAANTAGLACAIPYYGGGMPMFKAETPKIPVLAHFGETDTGPSPEQAREIIALHPSIEAHFYAGAGHGFNCEMRGAYHEPSATLAFERSKAFLAKHVG